MFKVGDIVTIKQKHKDDLSWINWFGHYDVSPYQVNTWKGKIIEVVRLGSGLLAKIQLNSDVRKCFDFDILELVEKQGHPITKIFK